jgi:hypothetical protein
MNIIVFGDSFTETFKALKSKHMNIHTFFGASMKGVGRVDNKNRKIIQNIVKKNYSKCLIFNFGHVDLFFSYYYVRFIQKKKFKMEPIIHNYVKFISSLRAQNKIIMAVYPSPVDDSNVFKSLDFFGIIPKKSNINTTDKKRTSNYNFRFNLYKKFNKLLKIYCDRYQVIFVDVGKELLDDNNRVKTQFKKITNSLDIHLLWEPILPILVSKLSMCIIPNIDKNQLKNEFKKYLINKVKKYNKTHKHKINLHDVLNNYLNW